MIRLDGQSKCQWLLSTERDAAANCQLMRGFCPSKNPNVWLCKVSVGSGAKPSWLETNNLIPQRKNSPDSRGIITDRDHCVSGIDICSYYVRVVIM